MFKKKRDAFVENKITQTTFVLEVHRSQLYYYCKMFRTFLIMHPDGTTHLPEYTWLPKDGWLSNELEYFNPDRLSDEDRTKIQQGCGH